MNWNVFAIWEHYQWYQIAFVAVITLEIVFVLLYRRRLFARKPKVAKEIK